MRLRQRASKRFNKKGINKMTHQDNVISINLAKLNKRITIVRPSKGKPAIQHMEAATQDVLSALNEHTWKKPEKIKQALEKKGYIVEFRDFNKGKPHQE